MNSAELIVIMDSYSVSGMPSYSLSMVSRFKINSDTLSVSKSGAEEKMLIKTSQLIVKRHTHQLKYDQYSISMDKFP